MNLVGKLMGVEKILWNEMTQIQKDKFAMYSLICEY